MAALIIFALIVLVFIAIYQIAKAAEHASILKGNEREQSLKTNKLMAWLMLITFILGMYGIWICHEAMIGKMLPIPASNHGVKYEEMLYVTLVLTGIMFFLTQLVLFYFVFKYRDNGKRKASFISHNNTLELIWTVVPAIFLVVLVVVGLKNWITMTGAPPEDAMVVEITGRQFNFIIRYPGPDGVFGKTNFRDINDENNVLGLDLNDPASKDDIIVLNGEMRLVVNKPLHLVIKSRDVLHSIGLPHFRMKMDAVPGLTTTMWFTPLYTTEEMKTITKNPDFIYEISCAEMCGKGHFTMRGTVNVVSEAEYEKWSKEQTPYLLGDTKKEDVNPPAASPNEGIAPPAKDSMAQKEVAKIN